MSHTKGEWKWGFMHNSDHHPVIRIYSDSETIVDMFSISSKDIANARLIAAAPDMYRALLDAKETIHAWHGEAGWDMYQHSPEMKRLNAAIAKAEGKS